MAHYGTAAEATTYHEVRGNAAWSGTDDAKNAALTRASAYIDGRGRYQPKCGPSRSLFAGVKTGGRAQELAWPRTGATDADGNAIADNEVPAEIEQATYEAALREIVSPGSLTPDYIASAQVTREKVGEIEVQYASSSASGSMATSPVIALVDSLLAGLLVRNCGGPAVFVV